MSYDISLCDPVTHETLKADSTHFIAGGMRAMGGTKELWLNVTYNYSQFYYRPEVFGEGGIRSIYGKTGAESIPMLEKAISLHWAMMWTMMTTGTPQRATPNVPCMVC